MSLRRAGIKDESSTNNQPGWQPTTLSERLASIAPTG
jgi:hypothetical protein